MSKRYSVISEIFIGVSGNMSSKRMMMFFSFFVMIFMAVMSTFYEKKIEQFIFDGFLYIVVGGLFSVASEQFASKFGRIDREEYSNEIQDDIIINKSDKSKRRR